MSLRPYRFPLSLSPTGYAFAYGTDPVHAHSRLPVALQALTHPNQGEQL
jgi:hypothetical protein